MPEILPPVLINNGQNIVIPSLYEGGNQIGPLFQTGTQGPRGPNIITSTTQSDGTANISILGLTIEDSLILNGENYSYSEDSLQAHRVALNIDELDNTSDADKPISNATQSALNNKSDVGHGHVASDISDFNSVASAAAPVQSVNTRVGAIVLTKSDVGLGNVDNTSDANKPISTATATALSGKASIVHSHTSSDITDFNAAASAAAPVQSINTRVGAITLSKTDVGLGNVDNTSDANKPISSATATALSGKVDKVTGKDLSDENYTSSEKTKLAGIADGAEVNVNADWNATNGDAQILNKPTLGSAAAASITDFATAAQGELADSALQPQSVNYLGEYNNGADYTYGDVVLYGGLLYIRVGEPNTGYPPGSSYWEEYKPEISSPAYDLYIQTNLDNKSEIGHGHSISDIADLQDALDNKQNTGDYATLVDGKVPSEQLPSYVDDVLEYADFETLPDIGSSGIIYVTLDSNKTYRWSGSSYIEISAGPSSTDAVPEGDTNLYYTDERASAAAPVQSVNGYTDVVTLNASDVGLGNVDNTSDLNKPISTATQSALDAKANLVDPVRTTLTGNGSTSVYAIGGATELVNPSALIVAIDGILQEPSVDYTVAGGNITFTSPLPSGSKAVVISPTNSLQVSQNIPADGSVTSNKIASGVSISDPTILNSLNGSSEMVDFLNDPSSANLAAVITDGQGSGKLQFSDIRKAVKLADETRTSTTLSPDSDLIIALDANSTYRIEIYYFHTITAGVISARFDYTGTLASGVSNGDTIGVYSGTSSGRWSWQTVSPPATNLIANGTSTTPAAWLFNFTVKTSSAGDFRLLWSSGNGIGGSSGTTTIKMNSFIIATKIS